MAFAGVSEAFTREAFQCIFKGMWPNNRHEGMWFNIKTSDTSFSAKFIALVNMRSVKTIFLIESLKASLHFNEPF